MERITREEMIGLIDKASGLLCFYGEDKLSLELDEAIAALQTAEPIGWITEDYDTDKSATTYDREIAERWRQKGWPVEPIFKLPWPPAKTEAKPAYRCHVCKAEVPPPEAFKLYVSCLSCGELTAATIAKDLAQPAKAQVPEGVDAKLIAEILTDYASLQQSGVVDFSLRYSPADAMGQADLLLTASPAPGQSAKNHNWDNAGERCLDCGDKDWFAGTVCEGKQEGVG